MVGVGRGMTRTEIRKVVRPYRLDKRVEKIKSLVGDRVAPRPSDGTIGVGWGADPGAGPKSSTRRVGRRRRAPRLSRRASDGGRPGRGPEIVRPADVGLDSKRGPSREHTKSSCFGLKRYSPIRF